MNKIVEFKAHELKVGDEIWFSDVSKSQKRNRFKPAIVKEIYTHHIVVEILTEVLNEVAIKRYKTSLNKTSINCGDIIVRNHVKQSEAESLEDLVAE